MQANCSTSFSPGNSGYPVYSSANMQPVKNGGRIRFIRIFHSLFIIDKSFEVQVSSSWSVKSSQHFPAISLDLNCIECIEIKIYCGYCSSGIYAMSQKCKKNENYVVTTPKSARECVEKNLIRKIVFGRVFALPRAFCDIQTTVTTIMNINFSHYSPRRRNERNEVEICRLNCKVWPSKRKYDSIMTTGRRC